MIEPPQDCCCSSIAASILCGVLLLVRNEGGDRRAAMYGIGVGMVLFLDSLDHAIASSVVWPAVFITCVDNVTGYLASSQTTRGGRQMAWIIVAVSGGLSVLDVASHTQPTEGWPESTQSRWVSGLSLTAVSLLFSFYHTPPREFSSFVFTQLLIVIVALVLSVRWEADFVQTLFRVSTVYPVGCFVSYYTPKSVRQIAAVTTLFVMSGIAAVNTYTEITTTGRKLVFFCCLCTCLTSCCIVFVTSTLSGHVGQVDKIWSVMPVIYSLIALAHDPSDRRIQLMTFCISIWGSRLTYNFYKRGGYPSNPLRFWEGELDYRWPHVKSFSPLLQTTVGWFLFNLFIITIYQMVLILWFSLPVAFCADEARNVPLSFWDLFCAVLMISFIVLEHIADEQHQEFQKAKHAGKPLPAHNGFFTRQLFSIVRHPNYASEQCIWASCFLFTLPHGPFFNWSSPGFLFLAMLFIGSSKLSEGITTSKYPKYVEYQKEVPRFFPGL